MEVVPLLSIIVYDGAGGVGGCCCVCMVWKGGRGR